MYEQHANTSPNAHPHLQARLWLCETVLQQCHQYSIIDPSDQFSGHDDRFLKDIEHSFRCFWSDLVRMNCFVWRHRRADLAARLLQRPQPCVIALP